MARDEVEAELWADYQAERSELNRNRLVMFHVELARAIALRCQARVDAVVPVEAAELIQLGVLGLMDAVERFDVGRGLEFGTFASPRVWGAIMDGLREMDPFSRVERQRLKVLAHCREQLRLSLGRNPFVHEVAECAGVDEGFALRYRDAPFSYSIDQVIETDGNPMNLADAVSDGRAVNVADGLSKRDFCRLVLKGMGKRERLVFLLIYYENMSMGDVGQVLGICDSRVSQLHTAAVERLRGRRTFDELRDTITA